MKKRKKTNQCLNLREEIRKMTTRGSTNTFSININNKKQVSIKVIWSSSSKASPCSMCSLLACNFSSKHSLRTCKALKLNTLKTRQDELWNDRAILGVTNMFNLKFPFF
ncbi:hypothetical protein PIB30_091890 [Stylosanthes scabra]|uniref:Uncharacterized protein n=1 Tax=Stylosanthes scabra TaxID=79078 RepID=A0ABU6RV73_9FABA|nr:hypothetical protein [Stylosanthes scabra]